MPKISIGPSSRGRLAWFNRRVVLDPAAGPEGGHDRASWLFVVSTEDHALSVARHGPIGFDRLLREYSRRCSPRTGLPLSSLPKPSSQPLRNSALHPREARWLSFLDRAGFSSELKRAEHAFFWNMFSNSTIARFMNRRPVFFLDCGHMARAIPGLTAVAINHYYAGASPEVFGAGEDWCLDRLGARACAQEEALAAARGMDAVGHAGRPDRQTPFTTLRTRSDEQAPDFRRGSLLRWPNFTSGTTAPTKFRRSWWMGHIFARRPSRACRSLPSKSLNAATRLVSTRYSSRSAFAESTRSEPKSSPLPKPGVTRPSASSARGRWLRPA